MALIKCAECGRQISEAAISCPGCGHPLAPVPQNQWNPGTAALLSLFFPGAGQLYKCQIVNGLLWFAVVAFSYTMFIVPGMVMHLFCVIGATMGDPTK